MPSARSESTTEVDCVVRSLRSPPVDPLDLPVFVICRDRLEGLTRLVQWLERAGHRHIILVDNDSTYPPLVEYLAVSHHRVEYLGDNLGHRSPWSSGLIAKVASDTAYIVTDPDVVPTEECPLDVAAYLHGILDRYPGYVKAGLGLRIDDLPTHYMNRADVIAWEAQFWQRRLHRGVYRASTDTTFAVYRAGTIEWPGVWPAIRTGEPYVARHLPWYNDSAAPSEEDAFYEARARVDVSNWLTTKSVNDRHRPTTDSPLLSRLDRVRWRLYVLRNHWRVGIF
ncbi:unannotated protein [freshwater metagenome]|uniref:Unannotated protein n=1 Tax=freshwater metagenome TaxID=449393 RepID=A0A6J6VE87_9ZZZZ